MDLTPGQELKGLKALLVCPSYGPIDPLCQKQLRAAMMSASNHGLYWSGDASCDHQKFSDSRNNSAAVLSENPDYADGIMWVDSDILLKPDSILKLLVGMRRMEVDFVTGVYHKKAPPYEPVMFCWEDDLKRYLLVDNYTPGEYLQPIGSCGFGFVWTSGKVIQTIAKMDDFEPKAGRWFPDTRDLPKGMGEDFNFCDKARRAGIQLHVHLGCLVEHMGDGTVFGREDYIRWLAANGGHYKQPIP